jgi:hypothetical protein
LGAPNGAAAPGDVIVLAPICTSGRVLRCGLTPIIAHQLQRGTTPLLAAQRVARLFHDARVRHDGHDAYPVGVIVNFDLRLTGFSHHLATVEWNVSRAGSGRPLPRWWWSSFVTAYQLRATGSSATYPLLVWVPEPVASGAYDVTLFLKDEANNLRGRAITSFEIVNGRSV